MWLLLITFIFFWGMFFVPKPQYEKWEDTNRILLNISILLDNTNNSGSTFLLSEGIIIRYAQIHNPIIHLLWCLLFNTKENVLNIKESITHLHLLVTQIQNMFHWQHMLAWTPICYGRNFIVRCTAEAWTIIYFIKMDVV